MLSRIMIVFLFPCLLMGQESQKETNSYIGLNSELTYELMEPNQNLRKLEILIDAKSEGLIPEKSLSFGFSILGIANYQSSNRDSKFAYLMRHPTSSNQIGETASEIVLHSAQVSLVSSINSWITAYGELLYSPEQSFGEGTITGIQRNQVDLRKGIILIGNLEKFPVYVGLGKMDVPFGQMRSVSPFTNSTMWHAFGPLAYSGVIGFKKYGVSASLTAIQGGAQFRAANVPVEGTEVPSRVNNFAADINYTYKVNQGTSIRGGISYIKGSAYNQEWPITHFTQGPDNNPAVAYYGELVFNNRLLLQGTFASTTEVWPGTFNPAPPLNEFEASKVNSLNLGARYTFNNTGNVIYSLSGEFSDFKAGPENSPWERQSQIVIGLNAQVEKTTRLFLEYFRTAGYAPLNFLTGGNFDNPGRTHSDRDARSFGFVLGGLLSI